MNSNNHQHEQARGWIHAVMGKHGIVIQGEIESIHERPWSSILKIRSDKGDFYFKATAGLAAHEIALTEFLSQLTPEHSPKLLVAKPETGWMIMHNGGQRLRESLIETPDWKHWESLLPQFASVQQEAAKKRDALLNMGLPNRSMAAFAQLYENLLAEKDWFQIDGENGLSAGEYERLQTLIPVVRQKAEALAQFTIPESLHHGDLHDANIFHADGRYSFYDWGDSSLSHPFFSLRTSYVSAENRFGLDEGAPELQILRNAYLAAWRDYESEANLLEAFGLAEELWAISSAFIWRQTILSSAPEERKDYAHVIPGLMREFMAAVKE